MILKFKYSYTVDWWAFGVLCYEMLIGKVNSNYNNYLLQWLIMDFYELNILLQYFYFDALHMNDGFNFIATFSW